MSRHSWLLGELSIHREKRPREQNRGKSRGAEGEREEIEEREERGERREEKGERRNENGGERASYLRKSKSLPCYKRF